MCFFAHCESELRRPEDDPVTAERQVQAEMAAEVQVLQQQHLAQALQTIFDASGVGNGNAGTQASSHSSGHILEDLLKQLAVPNAAPVAGVPDAANAGNGANALLHILQQLGNVQARQQQQQQPPPQPQQPSEAVKQQSSSVAEQSTTAAKVHQDSPASAAQDTLHMALKQVLEQQQVAATSPGNVTSQSAPPISFAATQPMTNLALPAVAGLQYDSAQLLQLDPSVLTTLLQQTTANRVRAAMPSNRHSIDNSFLPGRIMAMSGQMEADSMGQGSMMPVQGSQSSVPLSQSMPNGVPLPQGLPDVRQIIAGSGIASGAYMNGEVGVQQVHGTVNGVPLDHNPTLSSHFLQLDPAILNSLAMRARQANPPGGAAARMVDNGLLARMSNLDVSGIVNGVAAQQDTAGNPIVASGVPVHNNSEMQAGLSQSVQNGALASHVQALLQGLNLEGIKTDGSQPQVQYNTMSSYEKGSHHERVNSGNEGSVLMPSNMLQQ